MAISPDLLRHAKLKLYLLLTQSVGRSPGEELLLKTLGEDSQVLNADAEKRDGLAELSMTLPAAVADAFDQA